MNENQFIYLDISRRAISPESAEFMRKRRETPVFGINGFELEMIRQVMSARREPADMKCEAIPGDIDGISAEWVLAEGADPDVRLVHFHGGGYISGSSDFYIAMAARISRAAQCAVLLPNYRLSPDYPFPVGLEDCTRAYLWAREHGPNGQASARAIFISGDSAGGGLTLASLLALRDRGLPLPNGAIPISACADMTLTAASIRSQGELDPIMHPNCLPDFVHYYAGDADIRNPLLSPVFGDYAGLPPLLIQVAEHEIILDDSVQANARAKAAGVDSTLEIWGGLFHVFQSAEPALPETHAAIEHIACFMRKHMGVIK